MLSGTNSLPLHLFREGQERGTQCPVIKASSSHPVTAGWDQDVIALLCKKGLPPGRLTVSSLASLGRTAGLKGRDRRLAKLKETETAEREGSETEGKRRWARNEGANRQREKGRG